jgi:hypothetical protein
VLLVTHSLDLVTRFCDEALWLDSGVTRVQGDPRRVIDAYRLDVADAEDRTLGHAAAAAGGDGSEEVIQHAPPDAEVRSLETEPPDPDLSKVVEGRWGSREVEIVAVEFVGASGQPAYVFPSGASMEIRLQVQAHSPVEDLVFGVGVFNAEGVCCYGTNTDVEGAVSGAMSGQGEACFAFDRLDLVAGTYTIDVAVHRRNGAPYDYHRLLHTIRITSPLKDAGIFRPPHRWDFSGGIRIAGLGSSPGDPPGDVNR